MHDLASKWISWCLGCVSDKWYGKFIFMISLGKETLYSVSVRHFRWNRILVEMLGSSYSSIFTRNFVRDLLGHIHALFELLHWAKFFESKKLVNKLSERKFIRNKLWDFRLQIKFVVYVMNEIFRNIKLSWYKLKVY